PQRVVPATTLPAADAAESSGKRTQVFARNRGGRDARAGARSLQTFQDSGRVRERVLHGGTPGRLQEGRLPGLALPQGRGLTDEEALRRLLLARSVRLGDFLLSSGQRS